MAGARRAARRLVFPLVMRAEQQRCALPPSTPTVEAMILINVRFKPLPEYVENFREVVSDFTEASRKEDGCLFFEWFRNTDNPNEYILVEGFKDDAAEAHVNSDHFQKATELFPTVLTETPQIINTLIEGKTEWDRMAEFQVEK